VQVGVELPVAAPIEAEAGPVTGPDRDRRCSCVYRECGRGTKSGDPGGLSNDLRRGQAGVAGDLEKLRAMDSICNSKTSPDHIHTCAEHPARH
jgi:hypothetical protein